MRADFYILEQSQTQQVLQFACRLITKAYAQNHQLYIHTQSAEQARLLDNLLWTFRDVSFIPHHIRDNNEFKTSIEIAYQDSAPECQDVLINLSLAIPDFYQQFQRIIEIVPNEKNAKLQSREHYRFYRDKGYVLETHSLS